MGIARCIPLAVLIGLCVAGAAPAGAEKTRTAQIGEDIDWSFERTPEPVRYRVGDVTLTIRGELSGDMPELVKPVLTVEMPGLAPVTVEGNETRAGFDHRVTIGRWDEARPYVLFQSFSGGAHCCTAITLILPEGDALYAIDLGSWDGDYVDQPRDVDGDGRLDFVFYDNRFLYAFSSYAESLPPPLVLNVAGGQVMDVSDRLGFRPMFARALADARPGCLPPNNDMASNSACASYVATAARVGRFEEAWAEMLRRYNRNVGEGFPGTRMEGEADFPTALRAALVEWGYIAR